MLSVAVCGQQMKMQYLGELGHLQKGERVGPATGVTDGVVRMAGRGWSVTMGAAGGIGWTELYTADFDGDGQRDYLVGQHLPGVGSCVTATSVLVLVFDAGGRPVPLPIETFLPHSSSFLNGSFPFLPVWVMDRNRDGRAEFETTTCSRENGEGKGRVYVAGRDTLPGYGQAAEEMLEELTAAHVGAVIWEGRTERRIDAEHGHALLVEAMAKGYPVRRLGDSGWVWVDARREGQARDVRVEFVVAKQDSAGSRAMQTPEACSLLTDGESTLIRCVDRWRRTSGGTVEELLTDGVTVRTSHMAMQHTVTVETRYARPPGGGWLMGMATIGDYDLTQWGPGRFALHTRDGELVAARVEVPVQGELAFGGDGIVLVGARGELTRVRGGIQWRVARAIK